MVVVAAALLLLLLLLDMPYIFTAETQQML
jgi:hypothetical protein